MFSNQKVAKSSNILYSCDFCDYNTSKKYNYNKHILTAKHAQAMVSNLKVAKSSKSSQTMFTCNYCHRTYKDNSGLWRHNKKCTLSSTLTKDNPQDLIQYLIKENSEFKQLLIDQNKQMSEIHLNSVNNHINSHNKTFNLQVFLNETCKNAINMSNFIEELQVSINDLEETGNLGFAEGISKIFINGLKKIDISDRPLHCSNLKQETIYIKNNDKWMKDTEENLMLVNAIKHISNKNMQQIGEFQRIHPEYKNPSSKINDQYLKIVFESMAGSTIEECDRNYKKIISNIAKKTIINKITN